MKNVQHGHCCDGGPSLTYAVWAAMVQRCTNPSAQGYHNYGGRGLEVCREWLRFENFLADMGEKPDGLSIERIDNAGNYEPGNCRWATRKEQARNMRTTTMVTVAGITKPLAEWCELNKINRSTALKRINRSGWPPELAVTTTQLWSRP